MEICLDDNYEMESAIVVPDRMFEYSSEKDPACIKTDILQLAQQGQIVPEAFRQIKNLGIFYLETAFQYNLFR